MREKPMGESEKDDDIVEHQFWGEVPATTGVHGAVRLLRSPTLFPLPPRGLLLLPLPLSAGKPSSGRPAVTSAADLATEANREKAVVGGELRAEVGCAESEPEMGEEVELACGVVVVIVAAVLLVARTSSELLEFGESRRNRP